MADISYTLKATERRNDTGIVLGKGESGNLKAITATKSVTARSENDTIKFLRIPSNARILGRSLISWDDLASSGSPTVDIGLASVDANITSDDDALNDGLDVATAAGTAAVVKDHANYGKRAWEFVNGQTTDPKGELDVYITIKDAATNATGDVTIELLYTLD